MFLSKEKVKAPRNLRTARLSVVKNHISTPVIQTNVSTPNKVIKALYDYNASSPHELSFKRGDFFLVTGREGDEQFYEAFNPMTNSRGTVPVQYFQALEKHEKVMTESSNKKVEGKTHTHIYIHIHTHPHTSTHIHTHTHTHTHTQRYTYFYIHYFIAKSQPLYGLVMYDFKAERSDELDAKAGEAIIVMAQSNSEWYVAKPIGRLGGPGLIPVSFVDIRDAATGRTVENHPAQSFQKVEDWKKKSQGYEEGSIPLEHQMQDMRIAEEEEEEEEGQDLYDDYFAEKKVEEGSTVVSAHVDSYILEADQYWFIVFARLMNGKHRILYRLYEDFYDFHVNFLQEFPLEAGKKDQKRILPFMPGPVDNVDNEITEERSKSLSTYCSELLRLPNYLSESIWVQEQLFGIHEGDVETETDPSQPSDKKIKVKIVYKDEIFAIKVPVPSSLQFLQDKVTERLKFQAQLLQKDESNNYIQLTTHAFEEAVKLGKLTVFAG
ncbi:unnamed protein product [Rhizopus stolonifer]